MTDTITSFTVNKEFVSPTLGSPATILHYTYYDQSCLRTSKFDNIVTRLVLALQRHLYESRVSTAFMQETLKFEREFSQLPNDYPAFLHTCLVNGG